MPSRFSIFLMIFLHSVSLFSQNDTYGKESKDYNAVRIKNAPKIDGIIDEQVWESVPVASDFVMIDPGDGTPAPPTHSTEVKIAYTDEAIYVAALLFDHEPKNIRREFAQRDNLPVADYFVFDLNTYNDGENQTRFVITAAGTLADAKMKGENEDYGYNVVWEGKVSIDERGWYAEMRIPYSALRFPDKKEQIWSTQFGRRINHLNETYVWSYIDKSVGKVTHYNGLLKGISDIDAPVRLSFYPYVSGQVENYDGDNDSKLSAGMDFKYGINDAFTLDATLIPDFGQTAYDEVKLNLGPFEQTFGENRAFFTEGTELFTKGDLFYSRRIGDQPTGYENAEEQLKENEELIENPDKTDLLNALKISGRTDSGLGIGFFNAVTQVEKARFRDTISGETREITTEPFANYNIFVLDQQFNQKSSISLINTNVTRNGHFRDGNVTGFLFDVFNKSSSFNFTGEAKMSNVNLPEENLTGFASVLDISRTKGKFRYGVRHEFANETYDINDLGLNFMNNYNNFFWKTSYRIFEPTGIFNDYRIQLFGNHLRRYDPDENVASNFGASFFGITTDRFAFGGSANYSTVFKDFFEPRRKNRYVEYPENAFLEGWISSDYRKRIAIDSRLEFNKYLGTAHNQVNFTASPRFRVNNRFLLIYSFGYSNEINRQSFVALEPREIVFGNRDMESIENSLQGTYNFSTKDALSLSFRNFWSTANFSDGDYSRLLQTGDLEAYDYEVTSENDPNAHFNIWNLDLSYQWRFAPGSEMILLYRNSILHLDDQSELLYTESLENLFQQPAKHTLSLRIVYYLDYNNIKNRFKG
ncbi:DUF5916 domain-containing protein [Salinimicrobium gaetbulicola]|uniref:DUF5916 domain-containing protein n=1 Tax=Salinimicrobium gaetbulicola TaxID=999702 RepID=A0ABW3IDD8_9FLAO